ncbi:unnamed protein product [Leuciscus chuanchicus]
MDTAFCAQRLRRERATYVFQKNPPVNPPLHCLIMNSSHTSSPAPCLPTSWTPAVRPYSCDSRGGDDDEDDDDEVTQWGREAVGLKKYK